MKKLSVLPIALLFSMFMPLVAKADLVIAGSQCISASPGVHEFNFNYTLRSGFKNFAVNDSGGSRRVLQCWAKIEEGDYGSNLDVEIGYKDLNPEEDFSCFAESYTSKLALVDQTEVTSTSVEGTNQDSPLSEMRLNDKNLSNGSGAKLVKVECEVPKSYSNYQLHGPNGMPSGIKFVRIF